MDIDETCEDLIKWTTLYVLKRTLARRADRNKTRKPRTCWVKPWLQRRHQLGAYDTLMVELAQEDRQGFVGFQRIAPDLFGELLAKVGPLIAKKDTVMRPAISPGARLALTLRFLATGNTSFCT